MEAFIVHVPTDAGGCPVAAYPTKEEAFKRALEIREEFAASDKVEADDGWEPPATLKAIFAADPIAERDTQGWRSPWVAHVKDGKLLGIYCPCDRCGGKSLAQVKEGLEAGLRQDSPLSQLLAMLRAGSASGQAAYN